MPMTQAQRIHPGRKGKVRKAHRANDRAALNRQTLGFRKREIDHKADYSHRLVIDLPDPHAAHLHETAQRLHPPHQQAPITALEADAIVSNQSGEAQEFLFGRPE